MRTRAAEVVSVAKEAADSLEIEPRNYEDIQAAVREPDKASLGLTASGGQFELILQAKTRSTDPWSAPSFADVLIGKRGSAAGARKRPLAMLAEDPTRRYVFVTNAGVQGPLRPHRGDHLFDFYDIKRLPPYARRGCSDSDQASLAPRLLICDVVTVEILQGRIERILGRHGHVAPARHERCIRDLRDAVRQRMTGASGSRWAKADILATLASHGGSVLPTRAMDHYVYPHCYESICQHLERRHAVVISGPSGTGKTLTADIIELELRRRTPPFEVVTEDQGPSHVRSRLTTGGPVVFHLRDPWGSNRLAPNADRWRNELPRLLQSADAGRKFIVTSRSDIMSSAGTNLTKALRGYIVPIEVEDYDGGRLGEIYDRISRDLRGPHATLARAYRGNALRSLTRPYEIDRFLVALNRETPDSPRRAGEIVSESQIEAISNVVAEQIEALGKDALQSAAVIWAMLVTREAPAEGIMAQLVRRIGAIETGLRPDVNGLIDFLVAGRNLRRSNQSLGSAPT
jgi:hypothetical protein